MPTAHECLSTNPPSPKPEPQPENLYTQVLRQAAERRAGFQQFVGAQVARIQAKADHAARK